MKKSLSIIPLFVVALMGQNFVESWKNSVETQVFEKKYLYRDITPLQYLNLLRTEAGMTAFSSNSLLDQAAQNHAEYVVNNAYISHYQLQGEPFFTGVTPTDRAYYVGYNSPIGENLSKGQEGYKESIDDLFSAIYHRFGFLSFSYDLVGISSAGEDNWATYVYNLGNEELENLCQGQGFEGFGVYYTPCKDSSVKIEESVYLDTKVIDQNPDYVVWPYDGYTDTPPVFYEESPDPLPHHKVSGYPVSIEFNEEIYTQGVQLQSFELLDAAQNVVQAATPSLWVDADSDVQEKFSNYQFVLFPQERLSWDSNYSAKVVYTDLVDNSTDTIEWSFKTRSLGMPYYEVDQTQQTLHIKADQTYGIYMKPLTQTEYSNSYTSSKSSTMDVNTTYIDLNTVAVTASGEMGDEIAYEFNNGRSVTLILSETDNAIYPPEVLEQNTTQDQNTTTDPSTSWDYGLDDLQSGWHLLGAVETIDDMSIFDSVDLVWSYNQGEWMLYSSNSDINQTIELSQYEDAIISSISKGDGFWIYKGE